MNDRLASLVRELAELDQQITTMRKSGQSKKRIANLDAMRIALRRAIRMERINDEMGR